MMLDNDRIDESVLALLLLGIHNGGRAWKGFDWDSMDRLYEKGFISNPRSKSKSVVFTGAGEQQAKKLLQELFGQGDEGGVPREPIEHVYAIVRVDRAAELPEDSFTVKEIVRSRQISEAEVKRLNGVNAEKGAKYYWQVTRLFPPETSAGNRKSETA